MTGRAAFRGPFGWFVASAWLALLFGEGDARAEPQHEPPLPLDLPELQPRNRISGSVVNGGYPFFGRSLSARIGGTLRVGDSAELFTELPMLANVAWSPESFSRSSDEAGVMLGCLRLGGRYMREIGPLRVAPSAWLSKTTMGSPLADDGLFWVRVDGLSDTRSWLVESAVVGAIDVAIGSRSRYAQLELGAALVDDVQVDNVFGEVDLGFMRRGTSYDLSYRVDVFPPQESDPIQVHQVAVGFGKGHQPFHLRMRIHLAWPYGYKSPPSIGVGLDVTHLL